MFREAESLAMLALAAFDRNSSAPLSCAAAGWPASRRYRFSRSVHVLDHLNECGFLVLGGASLSCRLMAMYGMKNKERG